MVEHDINTQRYQSPVNDGNMTISHAALLADMEQVFTEAHPRLLRLARVSSIATGLLSKLTHRGAIALLVAIVQAIAIGLVPYAGGIIGALVCMFVMGFTNSITNVLFITLIQQNLPRAQLGRLMGVIMFASLGSYPISVLLAGILVTHTGPAIMFPISAAFLTAGALYGLARREIRKL